MGRSFRLTGAERSAIPAASGKGAGRQRSEIQPRVAAGQWIEMQAMACEVRRLAPRYFVQTPNLWFPYEPHYRSLFLHWFPEPVRAAMVLRKRRGFIQAASYDQAMREVQDIHLLSARQMAELFPDARIEREKVGPFTKSLIAVR